MTLEAIHLLIFGFGSGILLSTNFLRPYLDHSGGILNVFLLALSGFFVYVTTVQGRAKRAQMGFVIVTAVAGLIIFATFTRQVFVRAADQSSWAIHDGAVQTLAAADFLLQGVNPYAADFRGTPFGRYPALYRADNQHEIFNQAWVHYAYGPAMIVSAVPVVWLQNAVGRGFDVSWLYVAALGMVAWLLVRRASSWPLKTQAVLFTLGNPFIWLYAVSGFNDMMAPAAMIASAFFIWKQRPTLGGAMFGLAVGLKQIAWAAAPLWLVWVWFRDRRQFRRTLIAFLASAAALYLPFLIWNAPAMYDDMVRYVSGVIPQSYPIAGQTFLQYLHVLDLVESPWSAVPAYLFQVAVGIPVLALGWLWIRRRPQASTWLAASMVFLLAVSMVSRFFVDNHASALMVIAVGAYIFHAAESSESAI